MPLRFFGRNYTVALRKRGATPCRPESACACTGLLFFLPLVSLPDSRFGHFWANQGLIILLIELSSLLLWLIVGWLLALLGLIPFVGLVFRLIRTVFGLFCLLVPLFYIGYAMSYALRGQAKEVPLIGFLRLIR
ncbi:MAG: hypothetical protein E7618_00995 [Ruminococcaceae bacterium]|nr:hypothetical protein [Oscillospiraceae bacterium]